MTPERFKALLDRRIDAIRSILIAKAGEYATDADRLHNFKAGASISGRTLSQVCAGYALKHIVSVLEMAEGKRPVSRAIIDEKIGDAINYLFLIEALLTEGLGDVTNPD